MVEQITVPGYEGQQPEPAVGARPSGQPSQAPSGWSRPAGSVTSGLAGPGHLAGSPEPAAAPGLLGGWAKPLMSPRREQGRCGLANAWFMRGWSRRDAATRFDPDRNSDHRRGGRGQQLRRLGGQVAGAGSLIIGEVVSRVGEGVGLAIHGPGQWHTDSVAPSRIQMGWQHRSGRVVRGS
jgi:hypothetical protein